MKRWVAWIMASLAFGLWQDDAFAGFAALFALALFDDLIEAIEGKK